MIKLAVRVRRAIRRYGIIGTLRVVAYRIKWRAINLRPSYRVKIKEREQWAAEFDERYGIDTAGDIHQTKLNSNNPNQLYAGSYYGADPKIVRDAIGALGIDYQNFVFIDFGSGKGRAILIASEYPFKRIIGVEFIGKLHRVALKNIRSFHSEKSKCKDVECVCMDALDYQLPDDCLVCYFYNPFDATIMAKVLSNIKQSFLLKPREIYIVYCCPEAGHLFDQANCFRRIKKIENVCIWGTTYEP